MNAVPLCPVVHCLAIYANDLGNLVLALALVLDQPESTAAEFFLGPTANAAKGLSGIFMGY